MHDALRRCRGRLQHGKVVCSVLRCQKVRRGAINFYQAGAQCRRANRHTTPGLWKTASCYGKTEMSPLLACRGSGENRFSALGPASQKRGTIFLFRGGFQRDQFATVIRPLG